ncbi:right-handed parallel beta-helix repeat-containing protein [Undibacterium sp. TS12]|uniref:right-handed parallel beta-helix repeat-containing protein n=1 Tax=Undibacterium sp. TS12 TaxID=2908202 RepID=UPI001F4CF102|nr:right-handed parallel beta-helix repeat-containing protein [Undibacterium sp. TS12]MCH8621994.1 right-handed parallel beta-helix repeat-containing protein [Undibacterium sp. TS12]
MLSAKPNSKTVILKPALTFITCTLLAVTLPAKATTYRVTNAKELQDAIGKVKAGDVIQLAAGTYKDKFVIKNKSGKADQPIQLTGPAGSSAAVLANSGGYGLYLDHANYWIIDGITINNSGKGIILDTSTNNVLQNLTVHDVDDEGIHFRAFSTDNVLKNSHIYNTGKKQAGFGEGVYIGSANSNWCTYTSCNPDKSDRNKVLTNSIGPNVRAEGIDIKEGSSDGLIQGNTFDGSGISGENYADSVIDVKGNNYAITGNTVNNHPTSSDKNLLDGFQIHQAYTGWGKNNKFSSNRFNLNTKGYGINVQSGLIGNIVCDNNSATNTTGGVANVALVHCQ